MTVIVSSTLVMQLRTYIAHEYLPFCVCVIDKGCKSKWRLLLLERELCSSELWLESSPPGKLY